MNRKVGDLCRALVENALEHADKQQVERAQDALDAASKIAEGADLDKGARERAFGPLALRLRDVALKLLADDEDATQVAAAYLTIRQLIDAGPDLFK
ncbi:MAG: hypothetical protein L6Q84_28010 [Polyangiaceae bacterium]|nr:hypothetical protein [Polyangiaceae bacterium]